MLTSVLIWGMGILCIANPSQGFRGPSTAFQRPFLESFTNSLAMSAERAESRREFLQVSSLTAAGLLGSATVVPVRAEAATSVANPKVFTTKGGVKFIVIKEGTGPTARDGDFCVVEFTGFLPDGRVFDSSSTPGRKPIAFKLGGRQVIDGWEEVLRLMNAGAEVQMVVPAKLGYGSKGICLENGECLVKPDTDLRFDLQLKRVAVSP
ncbi:unnamed protein product [Discosporangium mesarthrocarpum]